MKILKHNSNREIQTDEDWLEEAGPKGGDRQWRDGRSAKELAKYWCNQDAGFPREIAAVLDRCQYLVGHQFDVAYPEFKAPFDEMGEGANIDLMAVGKIGPGACVMGIEAKADETFGRPVVDEFINAAQELAFEGSTNKISRLVALKEGLLRTQAGGLPRFGELRYQLFTAIAGILTSARESSAKVGIFLVQEFVTDKTKKEKILDNGRDLNLFVERISLGQWTGVESGNMVGPILVPGNARIPSDVSLFIGKVSHRVD